MKDIQIVTQHNSIINSRYKLNPLEIKLVLNIVEKIKKTDIDFFKYQIKIKDLGNLEHKRIKSACKSILRKPLEIDKGNDNWLIIHWFSSLEYKNGIIECSFDPKMKPYLLQLQGNFTNFNLKYVLPLQSQYSIRFYQLLKEFQGIGYRKFNLEKLYDLLQVPKTYQRFSNFKQKVLTMIVKEINDKTDLFIDYTIEKEGKKIVSIIFKIEIDAADDDLKLKMFIADIRKTKVNIPFFNYTNEKYDCYISVSSKGHIYLMNKENNNPIKKQINKETSLQFWKWIYKNKHLIF